MTAEKTFKYSETFYSIQGEGHYTGHPSVWIRFFLCNLNCDGFGQDNPADRSTYDLPYEKIDAKEISSIGDMPVLEKGCDSSYSWAKKFKHLMFDKTASEICDELESLMPGGSFKHPDTGEDVHLVFTGGEPMLSQQAMLAILEEFAARSNFPKFITIETNGTRKVLQAGYDAINLTHNEGSEWFWSLSPKLPNTSGEPHKRSFKPDIVGHYSELSDTGQLKFVVNGSQASWEDLHEYSTAFRKAGCMYPIWVMGVGGTVEGLQKTEAMIADETIQRGFRYSSRVHAHIWGNEVGK